jgi:ribosomal protein S18 acetylase RimI-like enzyme
MRPEDRESVVRIFGESFTGSYQYWSIRLLDRLETIVAEVDGEVVGAAELYVTSCEGCGKVGVVAFVAVAPAWRGRGIGKRLVEEAERLFRQRGCRFAAASTRSSNKASIALFTSLGYSVHERGDGVFEVLEDALYAYEDDVIFFKRL